MFQCLIFLLSLLYVIAFAMETVWNDITFSSGGC